MEKNYKEKIDLYHDFIDNNLKVDLKEIETKLNIKSTELNEWNEVRQTAKFLKLYREQVEDTLHILTPFLEQDGHEIHMNAEVENLDKLLINIGCNCSLEMDLDEASKYAEIRIKMIEKQIEHLRQLAVVVKVNIKLTLLAINEMNPVENIKF